MSPRQRQQPVEERERVPVGSEVPRQRAATHEPSMRTTPVKPAQAHETGGPALVASTLSPTVSDFRIIPSTRLAARNLPRWLTALWASQRVKGIASDALAVVLAILDVWLVIPEKAPGYSFWLSAIAVAAMVMRRHVPFLAVLVTVPGFLAGWAQLAAMIALGSLAKRKLWSWQLITGSILVFFCYYIRWPLSEFASLNWREHVSNAIWGVIIAAMPVAIGLLISAHRELAVRITELATSRQRERQLLAETVRAAERAKLAREMHDVVSHQVTLIAMQAGALQVSAANGRESTHQAATTIRELSTRTLEELRSLVGVLRSGDASDEGQPGLDQLDDLVQNFRSEAVPVALDMDAEPSRLPRPVSHAVYRTVQEALTNVRKHAAGARASVRVLAQKDTLLVEVRNGRTERRQPALPSGGHGLLGLKERAGLLGGTFQAGPTSEGGFRVAATYPLAG